MGLVEREPKTFPERGGKKREGPKQTPKVSTVQSARPRSEKDSRVLRGLSRTTRTVRRGVFQEISRNLMTEIVRLFCTRIGY